MKLNDEVLDRVKNFTHLWSKMAEDGDVTNEMSTRIALAANVLNKLSIIQ